MLDDSWKQQLKGPAPFSLAIAAGVWAILLLVVLFGDSSLDMPASAPVTRRFDTRLATGSADLPLDDPRIERRAGTYEPEQIHIALAGPQAMAVSWSTGNASLRMGQDMSVMPNISGAEVSQVGLGLPEQVLWCLSG